MSLRAIVKLGGYPDRSTILDWLNKHQEFSSQYARACNTRRQEKFDELIEICDTEPDVQRARLKVDVIKWQLSKEEPKKYGDRIEHAGDSDSPLTVVLKRYKTNEN